MKPGSTESLKSGVKVGVEADTDETPIISVISGKHSTAVDMSPIIPQQEQEMAKSNWTCHYVMTILTTILCFGPLSVIGLVHFLAAKTHQKQGNMVEARRRKRQAKCWTVSAFLIGLVVLIITVILLLGFATFVQRAINNLNRELYDYEEAVAQGQKQWSQEWTTTPDWKEESSTADWDSGARKTTAGYHIFSIVRLLYPQQTTEREYTTTPYYYEEEEYSTTPSFEEMSTSEDSEEVMSTTTEGALEKEIEEDWDEVERNNEEEDLLLQEQQEVTDDPIEEEEIDADLNELKDDNQEILEELNFLEGEESTTTESEFENSSTNSEFENIDRFTTEESSTTTSNFEEEIDTASTTPSTTTDNVEVIEEEFSGPGNQEILEEEVVDTKTGEVLAEAVITEEPGTSTTGFTEDFEPSSTTESLIEEEILQELANDTFTTAIPPVEEIVNATSTTSSSTTSSSTTTSSFLVEGEQALESEIIREEEVANDGILAEARPAIDEILQKSGDAAE